MKTKTKFVLRTGGRPATSDQRRATAGEEEAMTMARVKRISSGWRG
jgi:hypothetical protein